MEHYCLLLEMDTIDLPCRHDCGRENQGRSKCRATLRAVEDFTRYRALELKPEKMLISEKRGKVKSTR